LRLAFCSSKGPSKGLYGRSYRVFGRRKSSGNFAIFAAIRRASLRVNSVGVIEFWENSILGFAYLNMLA